MPSGGIRKFRIKHTTSWAWHIGIFFCVEPKNNLTGERDFYLFFCFGRHDISIGMLTDFEDDCYAI